MLILASTTDKLQLITGATGNINVHVSWMDNVSGAIGPGRTNTPPITMATTTDIVAPPAAGIFRNVKTVHIRNTAATVNDVTVRHTDGTTPVDLYKISLPAGATLSYIDEVGFFTSQPGTPPAVVFSTGDAKITLKSVADQGWIFMDDGTFGNVTSGSSNRNNADCQNLFTLFFNNITDAWAPMQNSSGVGVTRSTFADANAAWVANSRMTLTRQLGRAIAVAGTGQSLTARTIGGYDGKETHLQTTAELAQHKHALYNGILFTSSYVTGTPLTGGGAYVPEFTLNDTFSGAQSVTQDIYPATTTAAMDILNPRAYWNVMIKL